MSFGVVTRRRLLAGAVGSALWLLLACYLVWQQPDLVDIFRKTQDVMPIAEDAIAIGAKVLWQQLGVKNEAAAEKARSAGLLAVMDRCVKIEHGRLFGGLNWVGVNTRVISAKRPRWLAY